MTSRELLAGMILAAALPPLAGAAADPYEDRAPMLWLKGAAVLAGALAVRWAAAELQGKTLAE